MSLLSGLLMSGILTVAVSAAFAASTIALPKCKARVSVALFLAAVLLVVGGGSVPRSSVSSSPFSGREGRCPAGVVALPRAPFRLRGAMAAAWPLLFALTITAWLLMMPGLMLLDLVPGMPDLYALVPVAVACAFGGLLPSIVGGLPGMPRCACAASGSH